MEFGDNVPMNRNKAIGIGIDSVANDVEIAFGGVSGLGSMTRSGDEIKRH